MIFGYKKTVLFCFIILLIIPSFQEFSSGNNGNQSTGFIEHEPIHVQSDEDLNSFAGSGTEENPYVIEGLNITTAEDIGIHVSFTTKHFIIRNCYIDATFSSIYIERVLEKTAIIENNICKKNEEVNGNGISVLFTSEILIKNNICELSHTSGIFLWFSTSCYVFDNVCSNNGRSGIIFCFSNETMAANNLCIRNYENGIHVAASNELISKNNIVKENKKNGMFVEYSKYCLLINNTIEKNKEYGIIASNIDYNIIKYNQIQNNNKSGICLDYESFSNQIFYNNFQENKIIEESQAIDNGKENKWYSEIHREGNWWKDWKGEGSYSLDGHANAEDLYPLKEPIGYEKKTKTLDVELFYSFLVIIYCLIIFRKRYTI